MKSKTMSYADQPEEVLLEQCIAKDQLAFEEIVKRYQVLVCSLAYSIVGDVAASEDIGQEALLTVWRRLPELRQRSQFKAWLGTITRNLARASLRCAATNGTVRSATNQEADGVANNDAPIEQAVMHREESELVWSTLQGLPELYREPLVLYYRQDQSVSQVATQLNLTPDAVKQRLSRGRAMLRDAVLESVEQSLRKTAPAAAFTLSVMTVLTGLTSAATAATVGGAGAALTAKTSAGLTGTVTGASTGSGLGAAAPGMLAAVGGTLTGLLGGLFGAWCSWATAEYASQRQLVIRQSLIYLVGMLVFIVPFAAMWLGWQPYRQWSGTTYGIALVSWLALFFVLNHLWILATIVSYRRLTRREQVRATERLSSFARLQEFASGWQGRRWISPTQLWGWPLVQIAFSDPTFSGTPVDPVTRDQGIARAWIAVGERAYGRLLAIGIQAVAPIAIGNFSVGFFSCGVLSLGLVSTGVCAVGLLGYAVVAVGLLATGGCLAIGVHAVAPLAVAVHAAQGALAISGGYARGPVALAPQANTAPAATYLDQAPTIQHAQGLIDSLVAASTHSGGAPWLSAIFVPLIIVGCCRLAYRRRVER